MSAIEFRQPNLVRKVRDQLDATGLAPSLLELEITETAFLDRSRGAVEADLRQLGEVGVRIAVDDFGTGYSSLAYLSWLPIDTIKIDRGFVGAMLTDRSTAAIVQTIVALARTLEKDVVAEGIETIEQLTALADLGCREGQGFLLGRPMPIGDLRAHLPFQ
jgi:EAL domain-containing protein (putative c-di-GMP-specific phosphodiesterase class I)